jgi:hypothetical protein
VYDDAAERRENMTYAILANKGILLLLSYEYSFSHVVVCNFVDPTLAPHGRLVARIGVPPHSLSG